VERVERTWSELDAIQARVQERSAIKLTTEISPRSNTVIVETSAANRPATLEAVAPEPEGSVTVETTERTYSARTCSFPYCSIETRGAIGLHSLAGSGCTAGFVAFSRADLQPRLLTAGHCHTANLIDSSPGGPSDWYSWAPGGPSWQYMGYVESAVYGTGGDAAGLRINSTSYWYGPPYPFWRIAAWTVDEAYPIQSRAWPYVGQYGCKLSGINLITAIACGTVTALNGTPIYDPIRPGAPYTQLAGMVRTDACSVRGDSGGPFASYWVALGLTSGGGGTEDCLGEHTTWLEPVLHAETALGLETLTQFTPF
jgi:hypothetical protein